MTSFKGGKTCTDSRNGKGKGRAIQTPEVRIEAAYVGNRGAWFTAPDLSAEAENGLTPQGLLAERQYSYVDACSRRAKPTTAPGLRL
jgi:hypothetical protein